MTFLGRNFQKTRFTTPVKWVLLGEKRHFFSKLRLKLGKNRGILDPFLTLILKINLKCAFSEGFTAQFTKNEFQNCANLEINNFKYFQVRFIHF